MSLPYVPRSGNARGFDGCQAVGPTGLIEPTRERAILLNKAYMVTVRDQSFERGRDAVIGGVEDIHAVVEHGETDLGRAGKMFKDGRLWLDWAALINRDP